MKLQGMMKAIAGLSVLLLLSEDAVGSEVTNVYFVPFDVETYVPITRESIECMAHEQWTFSRAEQSSRLVKFLERGDSAQFDETRVRVKVVAPSATLFIDAEGVAQRQDATAKIDRKRFRELLGALRGRHQKSQRKPQC